MFDKLLRAGEKLCKAGFEATKEKATRVNSVREGLEDLDSETLISMHKTGDFSDKNIAIITILKDRGYQLNGRIWSK
ncbi:hypothetical protein NON08_14635 [Cetobacterium somerae]|uniref:hypothetical protein n=1 Tax=Cetobacterium sp. NK01 TaxID=2993530 RepID=UPI002116A926|nr:hypothetical protein [Cetobacterium sp. NK01]MCQ8213735.1 hypothetical protein [Cetobacterium sp. NK01]